MQSDIHKPQDLKFAVRVTQDCNRAKCTAPATEQLEVQIGKGRYVSLRLCSSCVSFFMGKDELSNQFQRRV